MSSPLRGRRPPAAASPWIPFSAPWLLLLALSGAARAQPSALEAGAREVSLAELLAYADEHAPAATLAASRQRHAEAARAEAAPRLRYNPTLELGAGPRLVDGADREGGVELTLALAQPLELPGVGVRRREAAAQLSARLAAEAGAARWQLRREVTIAFAAAVVARERVALAVEAERFAQELLATSRRRQGAGDASALEVGMAEVEVAQARQEELAARQEHLGARLHLAALVGWDPAAPPEVPAGLGVPPVAPPATLPPHPELRTWRAAVQEARAQGALAARAAWPVPVLGLQLAREVEADGAVRYQVLGTLGLSLPLWQRGQGERTRARVDEAVAQAEERAAAHGLRARQLRARAELETAAARLALFTDGVVPGLEDALALLRRGFAAGELPLLEVTVARERFVAARRASLAAYADYYRARAELEYALGVELPAAAAAGRAP